MPLVIADLADAINDAIGATDKDGLPISTTSQMETYAEAVINSLQAAPVSHLPGTVTGTAPPAGPGPVTDLAAANGTTVVPQATWLSTMQAGNPTANPAALLDEATKSTTYLSGAIKVGFDIGTMTGNSTAVGPPTPAPGVLVFVSGIGGKITGLSGSDWALAVSPPGADPVLAQDIYTAIVDYIEANADCAYAAGTVNGNFASAGAPLALGNGVGGTIS